MHDQEFAWEGRSIAWSRRGTGPAVVFVHGTPFSSRVWAAYAAELSTSYTVYTWDLPGYGESSKHSEHTVDLGVHARAFAALLAHWGLDAPHVVAHDIGGGVALRTHLVEQVPFASLLLADAVAIPPSGSPFFRFVQQHPSVLTELPANAHEALLRAYISGASQRGLPAEVLDELAGPWTGPVGQQAFYRQIADYDEGYLAENEAALERLSMPVRVLWGGHDAWLPVEVGRPLAGLIPGAQWREVEGAGHLLMLDAPVAVTYEITNWLAARTHRS
ncbi:alpha/beta fold hydrolase [Quadrisphaera granulorum]|nr:alpha/beta hydrolase [Quadrisphaera granulorum]